MHSIPFAFSVWTCVGSWIATSFLSAFPWVALWMVVQLVMGFRQYTITDTETGRRVQRRLVRSSGTTDNDKPTGWSVGRWFLLHLSQHRYGSEIEISVWILATPATFQRLTEHPPITLTTNEPEAAQTSTESVTILQRTGTFYHVEFTRRSIFVRYKPRSQQQCIMNMIEERVKKIGHCVAFLYGPPGIGKSVIGLMLAKSLRASYCNNLRMTQPGDTLARLHAEAGPSQETPLVVVLDEIDDALVAIHNGIPPHKNIPIPVGDKQGWNNLMDDVNHGMYPWLVLILTSNRGPDFVRGLDPAYIRQGRVDILEELH